jgi:hypothetical protein
MKRIISILMVGLALAGSLSAQSSSSATAQRSTVEPSAIQLRLETSKEKYVTGEPLVITAYLENTGQYPYYVGNTFAGLLGRWSNHYIELKIIDERNREVQIGHGGGDWIWKNGTPVAEKIAQAYVYLQAGNIHGVKEQLDWKFAPGQYRLKATYREVEALTWTDEERKSLIRPVWTQPLESNTVTISIVPKKTKNERGVNGRPNNSFNRSGISSDVIENLDAARQYFPPG